MKRHFYEAESGEFATMRRGLVDAATVVGSIEKDVGQVKAAQEKSARDLAELSAKLEAGFRKSRYPHGSFGPDELRNALPEHVRAAIPFFAREHRDPVFRAAASHWLRCRLLGFAKTHLRTDTERYRAEAATLERAFGAAETRAMSSETGSEGGYAVPSVVAAEVLADLGAIGLARRLGRVVNMTSKTMPWPLGEAAFSGAILEEEEQGSESDESFQQRTLRAKRFGGQTVMSRELVADVAFDLFGYWSEMAAAELARLEDAQAFEGDGTSFVGLDAATGVTTLTAAGTDAAIPKDLAKAVFALSGRGRRGAVFACSDQLAQHLLGVADSAGRPLLSDAGDVAPDADGRLLLRPLYASSELSVTSGSPDTGTLYFGNFRQGLIVGDRLGLELVIDPYTRAATSQFVVTTVKRTALLVAIPSFFARVTGLPAEATA